MTRSRPFGHGLVPTIFWGRNSARGREALRLLQGLDPDGCMERIRSRNRHPILLKSGARSRKPTPEVRGPPVSRQPQPPGEVDVLQVRFGLTLKARAPAVHRPPVHRCVRRQRVGEPSQNLCKKIRLNRQGEYFSIDKGLLMGAERIRSRNRHPRPSSEIGGAEQKTNTRFGSARFQAAPTAWRGRRFIGSIWPYS